MPGLDVKEGHGDIGRPEGFLREAEDTDRVLTTGEKNSRTLELRRDFAQDVHRLGFEVLEVVEMITAHSLICVGLVDPVRGARGGWSRGPQGTLNTAGKEDKASKRPSQGKPLRETFEVQSEPFLEPCR